tara:strand:+ start:397 stop:618 length:222 start_codon:yes stop_codon:yes gene_type:complete
MFTISILSAIGFLIISLKALGLRGTIKHEIRLDVGYTIGMFILSNGTLGGITMAITSGVLFSVLLFIIKLIFR